jgi:hypothetical protein
LRGVQNPEAGLTGSKAIGKLERILNRELKRGKD